MGDPKRIELADLHTLISPGSRIFLGTGCSEPALLTPELCKHSQSIEDCQFFHFLSISESPLFSEQEPSRFRHNILSIIGNSSIRRAINEGKSDFTPVRSSEMPSLIRGGLLQIDICFLQVSPPDKYGYCSLGINVDINRLVADTAETLIVQINSEMPRTLGDSFIRFENIDYYIEAASPLLSYTNAQPLSSKEYTVKKGGKRANDMQTGEKEEVDHDVVVDPEQIIGQIGKFVIRLIENRSTLNLGLGRLVANIWPFLKSKRDLAIYSEALVLTPAFFDLIDSKVISCKANTYPHIMTSFVLGTPDLYPRVSDNPFFEFHSTEFITAQENIGHNEKLVSIYGAIEVDLTGNVSNHCRSGFYGGSGGELEFLLGSGRSRRGKTIIMIPSTTSDGKRSRIQSMFGRVTIPGFLVDYVVTEWGIARMKGRSVRNRALQLIGVAHPKFRKDLLAQAKDLHYIYPDQRLPTTTNGEVVLYPERYESWLTAKNGEQIFFRPTRPTDEPLLQQLFYKLDENSRIARYLTPKWALSHKDAQSEVVIDYHNRMSMVGVIHPHGREELIAIGSYYKDESGSTNIAEIAVLVSSEYQKMGLGNFLFKRMISIARDNGITGVVGEVLSENQGILNIIRSLPYPLVLEDYGESMEFSLRIDTRTGNRPIKGKTIVHPQDFMDFKNPMRNF